MKKVMLNCSILNLKGDIIKDQTGKELKINELVANYLSSSKKTKDAMRKFRIAQAMYLDGDMELEDADYKMVKEAVEEAGADILVTAQIFKALGEKE